MPLFVTVLEGRTPEEARPILAIRDHKILAAVRTLISERLTEDHADRVVSLSKQRTKAVQHPSELIGHSADVQL
jgi:hypothetical protein